MDIKSKKYKIKRNTALFLAIVTFAFSALCAECFVSGYLFYNREKETPDYCNTDSFKHSMRFLENVAMSNGEIKACETEEDYLKTEEGKAQYKKITIQKSELKDSFEILSLIDDLNIYITDDNVYMYSLNLNNKDYYFSYNGDIISYEEFDSYDYVQLLSNRDICNSEAKLTDAEINSVETTYDVLSVSKHLKTIWNNSYDGEKHLNYGEVSLDNALSLYDESHGINFSKLDPDYHMYDFNTETGFKYAIFYPSIKKVLTNCDVKYTDNTETTLKKLETNTYEYLENGQYYSSFSNEKEFLDQEDIDLSHASKMYFGWDKESSDLIYSTGYNCYRSFNKYCMIASSEAFLILFIIFLVFSSLSGFYYLCVTGAVDDNKYTVYLCDKIPIEILSLVFLGISALAAGCIFGINCVAYETAQLFYYNEYTQLFAFISLYSYEAIALLSIFVYAPVILLIGSIVRNARAHTLFKNSLLNLVFKLIKLVFSILWKIVFKVYKLIINAVKKVFGLFSSKALYKKTKLFYSISLALIALVSIVLMIMVGYCEAWVLGEILIVISAISVFIFLVGYCRIAKCANEIKSGNADAKVNKSLMPGFMKSTALDIEQIGDGIQEAVKQATADQIMKTELITNVTHDLKTPLTSIITYVDLLKSTESEKEKSEYLNVLDEKSLKLKKLIDDLVQASKASSGAIKVNSAPLNLSVFAEQLCGEYSDELRESEIDLISVIRDNNAIAFVDADITSRIFENLITNIKKYSVKGTRAYIEVSSDETNCIVSFKNISSQPLNYSQEKLKERFFRADSSRGGEGSGLGLSITDDLCSIQNGKFNIETDGDLFKAIVYLPKN